MWVCGGLIGIRSWLEQFRDQFLISCSKSVSRVVLAVCFLSGGFTTGIHLDSDHCHCRSCCDHRGFFSNCCLCWWARVWRTRVEWAQCRHWMAALVNSPNASKHKPPNNKPSAVVANNGSPVIEHSTVTVAECEPVTSVDFSPATIDYSGDSKPKTVALSSLAIGHHHCFPPSTCC